jgi:hypothetical protein
VHLVEDKGLMKSMSQVSEIAIDWLFTDTACALGLICRGFIIISQQPRLMVNQPRSVMPFPLQLLFSDRRY